MKNLFQPFQRAETGCNRFFKLSKIDGEINNSQKSTAQGTHKALRGASREYKAKT
jgi:hypothetical protein